MHENLKEFELDFEKQLNDYFTMMKAAQSIEKVFVLISTWLVRALAVRDDDPDLAKSHFNEAKKWVDELGKRLA